MRQDPGSLRAYETVSSLRRAVLDPDDGSSPRADYRDAWERNAQRCRQPRHWHRHLNHDHRHFDKSGDLDSVDTGGHDEYCGDRIDDRHLDDGLRICWRGHRYPLERAGRRKVHVVIAGNIGRVVRYWSSGNLEQG